MTDNVLIHYGILGMRWGVRKDRSYVNGGRISKGTKFVRLSTAEKEKHKGSAYAYLNENIQQDPNTYQKDKLANELDLSLIPQHPTEIILATMATAKCDKMTIMSMELKEDLILPSMKEKGETFAKLYLESEEGQRKLAFAAYKPREELGSPMNQYDKTIIDRKIKEALEDLGEAAKIYKTKGLEFKKDTDDSYRFVDDMSDAYMRDGYKVFYKALADKGIQKEYFGELSKKGYNAVTDDHDIRLRKEATLDQMRRLYQEKGYAIEDALYQRKKKDPLYSIKHPIENFKDSRMRKKYGEASSLFAYEKTRTPIKRELGGNEIIIFDRKKSLKVYSLNQVGTNEFITTTTPDGKHKLIKNPDYKK